MSLEAIVLVATFVIGFALVVDWLDRRAVSAPMVFVAFGLLVGPEALDVVEIDVESEGVLELAEATLAILLFSDAARVDFGSLRANPGLPVRLLGIGLPLTVALGTATTALLLTDLSTAEAALVAAILTPTDAAVGQAVVTDERVPVRIRQSLNVESGLNDGLMVPIIAVFTAMVETEFDQAGTVWDWVRDALEQLVIGLAAGVVVASLAGRALSAVDERSGIRGDFMQLATLAIGVLAYGAATLFDGNGFIAAFVAGLTLARSMGPAAMHRAEFSEDLAQLLAMVTFMLFGAIMVGPALANLTVPVAVCAVLTLTVGRMLPVAVATIGAGVRWPTRLFMGWFGPRGLASILFGLVLVVESEIENESELFGIIAMVVLFSIVAHGVTARPGARRYGTWYENHPEIDTMAESVMDEDPILRWDPDRRARGEDGPDQSSGGAT